MMFTSPAVQHPGQLGPQSRNLSLPGYKLCAHHLLSTYYLSRFMLGGSRPQHLREDRAVDPQYPGQVAMAASC